jgi:tryptophan 2,3-dioxygenase
MFEHLYWQAAGKDYQGPEKSYLPEVFERKQEDIFLGKMKEYNSINIWQNSQLPVLDQTTRVKKCHVT